MPAEREVLLISALDWLAGGVSITYQVVGDEEPSATDMSDTIAKLQKRVENYSTEAIVYQEGTDRINIEIPGVSDAKLFWKNWADPVPCTLLHRQMQTETRTIPHSMHRMQTEQSVWFIP